ncbi:flagellar biosynthesis anti-sigma factor FlgM [Botrimarina sp.]|uniref:flagellar biosynthesis anti-sigma factor FlgM n=1 Tax=Botrimarina sp. TaxID=2795802 RepID=UPI0032F07B67
MQVNGPTQIHGPQALSGPHFRRSAAPAAGAQASDQVTFSAEAQKASAAAEALDARAAEGIPGPDGVRSGLVNRLKGEIAAGRYESIDKFDTALDRLLDQIG